jgi:hypothetical protein
MGVPIFPGGSGIRQNSDMSPLLGTLASSATAVFATISWHTRGHHRLRCSLADSAHGRTIGA